MTIQTRDPLTLADAVALATVIGWAQRNARVTWLDDRNEVRTGTARAVGDERGCRLAKDEDVRDAFLRVTTDSGFEWFVPVPEVIERNFAGTFVEAI